MSAPGSPEEYRKLDFVRQWICVDSRGDDFRKVSPHYAGLRSCPRQSTELFEEVHTQFLREVDSNPVDGSLHAWKCDDSTSFFYLAALVRCLRCLRRTLFCSTVIRFMRQSLWQSLVLCLVCLRSTRLRLDSGYSAFVTLLHLTSDSDVDALSLVNVHVHALWARQGQGPARVTRIQVVFCWSLAHRCGEVGGGRERDSSGGILDHVTRQHTAMNHSKSYEALKKFVQDIANNSTTGQETCRLDELKQGATAPTTAWSPFCGIYGVYKGGGKANTASSYGPVKGYQKGDGKSGGKGPVVAKASLAVDIISHGALEAWEAWEEAPTGRTRTCSVRAKRGATQARSSTATAARTEEEVMTCADMNCTHNGGH